MSVPTPPPIPLRDVVVTVQAPQVPPNVVLTADRAEWQQVTGVNHVSVFQPYQRVNGGPGSLFPYRVSAVVAANGQPIQLQQMWFGGFAPYTGAARFADQ